MLNDDIETLKKCIKSILVDIEDLCATENIEIISPHHELLEKMRLDNFWYEVDFTTLHMLINVLAPLMKYKSSPSYRAMCSYFKIDDYDL